MYESGFPFIVPEGEAELNLTYIEVSGSVLPERGKIKLSKKFMSFKLTLKFIGAFTTTLSNRFVPNKEYSTDEELFPASVGSSKRELTEGKIAEEETEVPDIVTFCGQTYLPDEVVVYHG